MTGRTGMIAQDLLLVLLIVGTQFILARLLPGLDRPGHTSFASAGGLILLLSLPFLLLLRKAYSCRSEGFGSLLLGMTVLAGLGMRLPYLGAPPLLEDDHYRYLLDGALTARGLDPYYFSPAQLLETKTLPPAVDVVVAEGRDLIARINFSDLRTIYPGTAQALFALAHRLVPWSLDGLRLVMLLCEATTTVLLVMLLRSAARSPLWAMLYWCNPLMAFTLTGQAHVDAALPPVLLGALMATGERKPALAGTLLGLAAGIKLWPVLLFPLLCRASGGGVAPAVRLAGATAVSVLLICGPLVYSAFTAGSGLLAYAGSWSVNNAPYAWALSALSTVFPAELSERLLRMALAGAAGLVALALAWHPVRDKNDTQRRALMLSAAVFYLSPAQFPWYSVWFLPLAAAAGSLPLLLASATLPVYYLFFPMAEAGLRDLHSHAMAAVHALPVFGWLAWRAFNSPVRNTA